MMLNKTPGWQSQLHDEILADPTLTASTDEPARKGHGIHIRKANHDISGTLRICVGTSMNGPVQQRGQTLIGRYRFTENTIQQMLQIAWWHWSTDRMKRNPALFNATIPADVDVDLLQLVQD